VLTHGAGGGVASADLLATRQAGLDAGANDYLTKPFAFEEFLARLRAVSRRGSVPRPTLLQVGDLILNPASHEVTRGGEPILLSRTEYRLLEFLMRRAGRVVPRNTIVHSVWDDHDDVEENTLDVCCATKSTAITK
jgi:DNA-binding response OmpR family regulator